MTTHRWVRITAKAGCLGSRPNSRASFDLAFSYPVDGVEADIRFDELGMPYVARDRLTPREQRQAVTVPDLLRLTAEHPAIRLYLNLREFSGLKHLAAMIQDAGLQDRVVLLGVPLKYLAPIRRTLPEMTIYVSATPTFGQRFVFGACDEFVRRLREGEANGLVTRTRLVTRLLHQVLDESRLELIVETVDRERDMRRLTAFPVHGIITNRIDKMIDLRSRLSRPSPTENHQKRHN